VTDLVIVVDMQADFVRADGALPVPGAEEIVAPMETWLAALDPAATAGVLLTYDTHYAETYADTAEAAAFPIHCVRGTEGWRGMLDLGRVPDAIPLHRLEKGVFDMWAEPAVAVEDARDPGRVPAEREAFFADLRARGVTGVTVVGVAADYCVRWAAAGALARGFRVAAPAHLTRGIAKPMEEVAAELGI